MLPGGFLPFFGKRPIDKQFGVIEVARALENADAAQLIAGAFARYDQLQRCALVFLQGVIVEEADANRRFTAGGVARRGYAGFGVLRDVRVQLFEVIEGFVFAPELDEGGKRGVSGAGALRVGNLHFAFVFRLGQVFPALRHFFDAEFLQALGVHPKAKNPHVNRRGSVAFHFARIAEALGDLRQVG